MQHPDEGTIHAWLEGQLPRDEAAAIEAHVAECRPCADAVAEARGLIAASSRILMALDSVPRGVTSKPGAAGTMGDPTEREPTPALTGPAPNAVIDLGARAATTPRRRAPRRWLSGPSLAAAAAVVIAVGSFAVVRNRGEFASVAMEPAAGRVSEPSADSAASIPSASSAATGGAVPAAPAPALGTPPAANERVAETVPTSIATADRVERSQAQQGQQGNRAMKFTPRVEGAVASAKTSVRDEAKIEAELTRKVDPSTVTIIRGRSSLSVDSIRAATPAPTPAPAASAQASPPPALRDGRPDAPTSANTGRVSGRVTDGNGTGIPGVLVTVVGSSTGGTTDNVGQFSLAGVPPGQVQLLVRRVGYEPDQRAVTVVPGQTATTQVILRPAVTSLSSVVVTGADAAAERRSLGSSAARSQAPRADSAPGAAVTATQSRAIGCYELGVTSNSSQPRAALRQVPRRIALDADIVPANADGIWYRARDLVLTTAVANGLWRPVGTDGVEIEWLYGSKLARIRLTGPATGMMRGTVEEIDRSAGTNESGNVVSSRRTCQ